MTTPDMGDEWTEAVDADIPRVDLVGKAANGTSFLLMKQDAAGLMDPDEIRDLIAKADEDADTPPMRDDITLTGSPAAITKMIAEAAARARDPKPAPAAAPTQETPAMTAPVVKADEPVDADPAEIDLTEPLADSSDVLAESMPGSSAWEQLDADSAMKWTAVLGRAKNALEVLATRERVEAESPLGDSDDDGNAWDLDDACCALDFAIGTLAAYAVGEQAEAEQMAAVTKAAAEIDPNTLAVIEGYGVLRKAGRVLSAANEAAIRGAVDSLQNVLNTLPAPIPDAAPVAKETSVTQTATETVAKGDPQMVVFDADGNIVGTISPDDLSPIAKPAPPEGGDATGGEDAPAAAEAAPDAAQAPDNTVAPAVAPDATTIPGTNTVQAPPVEDTVTKATEQIGTILKEALAAQAAEQEARYASLAATQEVLKEQVEQISKMPDDRKSPRLNGATGVAGPASRDDSTSDPFADLRKAADEETDPIKKRAAQNALFYAQVKQRVSIHS